MLGDEYDRWVVSLRYLLLQIEAIDIGQFDIQNQASWALWLFRIDVFARRRKCVYGDSVRCQQFTKRFANTDIVVNDEDDLIVVRHATPFASIGKVKTNVEPADSVVSTHNFPP